MKFWKNWSDEAKDIFWDIGIMVGATIGLGLFCYLGIVMTKAFWAMGPLSLIGVFMIVVSVMYWVQIGKDFIFVFFRDFIRWRQMVNYWKAKWGES